MNMTHEDAIKKINLLKMVAVKKGTDTEKAVDMAIEALKEQQPKKAKKVVEELGWLFGDCPSCGSRLNNKDYPKACGKCGQALEWGGEHE